MSLPFELSYGIEMVLRKLRPGATFTVVGTEILDWVDPENRKKPTWDEISIKLEELHAEYVSKK
jgi:hypothetical protein